MNNTTEKYLQPVILAILIFITGTSQAMEIHGLAKIVVDSGGDSMDKVPSISPVTTKKVRANDVWGATIGLSFMNDARNFAVDATLGAKNSWPNVGQGSIQDYSVKRGELEVLAFYCLPPVDNGKARIRVGAGPTLHTNPRFVESGTLAENTTKFDNALGFTFQLDSTIPFRSKGSAGITFGLRYSSADYKADGIQTIRAGGLGIFIGGTFPIGLNRKR